MVIREHAFISRLIFCNSKWQRPLVVGRQWVNATIRFKEEEMGGASKRHKRPREQNNEEKYEEEEEGEAEAEEEMEKLETDLVEIAALPRAQEEEGSISFVLEKASLEVAKVGKTYQLLNCDDHAHFLRKHKRDPAAYRPDIIHQALLAVLDSPLNKAGRLKALYVQTEKNVLIQVNPHARLPRTFKRFCGLMVQLLQKLAIRATNGPEKLLSVIKNPITSHLPDGARRIGFSYSAPKVVQLRDYIGVAGDDSSFIFVVGAMAYGKIDADYIDDLIAISEYPLSAACCIGRICNAVEQKWKIL